MADHFGTHKGDLTGLSRQPQFTPTRGEVKGGPQRSRQKERTSSQKGPLRHLYELPLIGNAQREIQYLTLPEIRAIHHQLIADYDKSPDPIDAGERDGGNVLEAASMRPHTAVGSRLKYPTVEMAAAALLHSLIQDHPFHDGNKRTGIVSCLVFLDKNNYVFNGTDTDLFETAVALARHELVDGERSSDYDDREMGKLAGWVKSKSRKIAKGSKNMQWKDLKGILRTYGCEFEKRRGNKIVVRRDGRQVNVGARNDGAEIDRSTIQKIRKDLDLLEEDGVDEEVFFYGAPRIEGFINQYRKTLDDLAAYDRS